MTLIKFIYILIKLTELLTFIIVGIELSKTKNNKDYWKIALPAIIVFALVDGLRYGRLVDYYGYLAQYNLVNTLFSENIDPLFSVFMFFFKETGLGFTSFMVAQSAILMFACFVLLKPYRIYAKFALPLLLPLLVMNENLTRWFLACSFLIFAYDYLNKKRYPFTIVWLIAAQLTHNAIFPLFLLILLFPMYNKVIIPRRVALFLFIFMTLFSNIKNATFIVQISDFLLSSGLVNENMSMMGHMLHAQDLIQGEHLELGIMQNALYQKIISIVIWSPIIWFGYIYANNEHLKGIYNITVVSIILSPLLSQVELLSRYTMFMGIFSFIIAGIYYYNEFRRRRKDLRFSVALISLLFFMYPTISLIFNRGADDNMLFIWDAVSNF